MKYKILLICLVSLLALSGISCTTTAKSYTVQETIDGQDVEVDVLKINGIGKAQFEEHKKIEGKPIIQFPELPPVNVEPKII